MDVPVNEDQIRTLAFYLWEKDGCPEGRSDEYWESAQATARGCISRGLRRGVGHGCRNYRDWPRAGAGP